MRRLHADGRKIVVITNESTDRFKKSEAIEKAILKKTGRLIVAHEAHQTNGFGAEIATTIQKRCFEHLEAPIGRVCGFDTHFPYAWEEFYVPSASRVLAAIEEAVAF